MKNEIPQLGEDLSNTYAGTGMSKEESKPDFEKFKSDWEKFKAIEGFTESWRAVQEYAKAKFENEIESFLKS